jgi:hypothetical protein
MEMERDEGGERGGGGACKERVEAGVSECSSKRERGAG